MELEQGIEGLVHVSEMTWSKRMKHPSKLVNVGDQVDCVVLSVNPQERRISLGMRQLAPNPWDALHDKYPVGATVEGRVRNLTDFGAFIEIEEGIDGLVHVSNLSWTKRVKHPSEVLKKGDRVKAMVLAIEPDKRRLSLGVKQLQPDVWETFFDQHHVGDVVHGKVLRVASFGAFVEIAEGIEGLCHNSEAVDGNGQPMTSRARPRARLQNHQDESGREESRPQHQSRWRRSLAFRSGGLQATGFQHGRFHDRRSDHLETGRRRKQLKQPGLCVVWSRATRPRKKKAARKWWPFFNSADPRIFRANVPPELQRQYKLLIIRKPGNQSGTLESCVEHCGRVARDHTTTLSL